MKKLLLVLVIIAVPSFLFADLQIGGIAMYNGSLSAAARTTRLSASDFTYGAEARLNIWILQAGISALYLPGDTTLGTYDMIRAMTDVGAVLDLWILRLGAGIGPNFAAVVDKSYSATTDVFKAGFNAKLEADLSLGNLAAGLVGYYYFDSLADLKTAGSDITKAANWMVGLTFLFKLF
jgi:hypothetical protein